MSGSGCLLPWLFGFIGKDSSFLLLGQLLVLSGEVRATGRAPPLCLTRPRVWTPGGRVALTGRLQVAADLWVTRPPAPSLAAGAWRRRLGTQGFGQPCQPVPPSPCSPSCGSLRLLCRVTVPFSALLSRNGRESLACCWFALPFGCRDRLTCLSASEVTEG